jgi:hypothetical protein
MSSKSKKKSTSSSTPTAEAPAKKLKLPKAFIVRPSATKSLKTLSKICINAEILQALELSTGLMVYIYKVETGQPGVLGTIHGDNDLDKNVITISSDLRSLGGFLQGDRVQFESYSKQPSYAKSVDIKIISKENSDVDFSDNAVFEKVSISLQKSLDEVGILFPGLIFHYFYRT